MGCEGVNEIVVDQRVTGFCDKPLEHLNLQNNFIARGKPCTLELEIKTAR